MDCVASVARTENPVAKELAREGEMKAGKGDVMAKLPPMLPPAEVPETTQEPSPWPSGAAESGDGESLSDP